jgi:large subunit ribosomal protein L15
MKLNDLVPNEGATKNRKRVGRGISAGQGKTAGRGQKGQKKRTGWGGALYRQGGNLPFYRRLPFMRGEGFTPFNRVEYNEINVDRLNRFPANSEIGPETLEEAGMLSKPKNPVVILGRGDLKVSLKVKAHRVTKGAQEKIEAAGGSVELVE